MPQIVRNFSGMFYNNNRYSVQINRKKRIQSYKINGVILLISFLLYYALEISTRNFLFNGFLFTPINTLIVFGFIYVFSLVFVRRWISSIVCSILLTAVALINFYTILFRNQPVSTMDIGNINAALDVLPSYKPGFHMAVVYILLIFVISILLSLWLRKFEKEKEFEIRDYFVRLISTVVLSFMFLYIVFFASFSIKPKLTLVWSWEETYRKYGFLSITEELFVKSFNVVRKPENYDEDAIKKISKEQKPSVDARNKNARKPDIILIMNETWFDLRNVVDGLKTNKDFMPFIDNLDNKISGFSIVPGNGGGTNRSEYELLSSNSLHLTPGITPFSFLNLENSGTIVSFLESQGYTTAASHCAGDLNYSRGLAYPKIGFDNSYFIEDFGWVEILGKRPYATDEFVYRHMIEKYNNMGDGPRFFFNLTIQNHGAWDMNDESLDNIKVKNDFGENTDDVNEYLSCVSATDSAFEYLVNYFKDVERDVIICMVGDHSPVFTPDIATVDTSDPFENLKLYATPFVIWANFNIPDKNVGYTSMPYMLPLTLKAASAPKSPFYDHMINMFNKYPVVTSNGCYIDKEGKLTYYNDKTNPAEIKTYFDMVYNRTCEKVEEKLFTP